MYAITKAVDTAIDKVKVATPRLPDILAAGTLSVAMIAAYQGSALSLPSLAFGGAAGTLGLSIINRVVSLWHENSVKKEAEKAKQALIDEQNRRAALEAARVEAERQSMLRADREVTLQNICGDIYHFDQDARNIYALSDVEDILHFRANITNNPKGHITEFFVRRNKATHMMNFYMGFPYLPHDGSSNNTIAIMHGMSVKWVRDRWVASLGDNFYEKHNSAAGSIPGMDCGTELRDYVELIRCLRGVPRRDLGIDVSIDKEDGQTQDGSISTIKDLVNAIYKGKDIKTGVNPGQAAFGWIDEEPSAASPTTRPTIRW